MIFRILYLVEAVNACVHSASDNVFLSGQGLLEVAKLFCHLLEIEILK